MSISHTVGDYSVLSVQPAKMVLLGKHGLMTVGIFSAPFHEA